MRLLKLDSRGELSLTKELFEKDIPTYAILSHTWGPDEDEVTFDDLENGTGKSKAGYIKLQFCGQQAQKDGLQHFWVDTCCIKKANEPELTEAIVSMFRWYGNAARCYVFLSDVSARKRDNEGAQGIWESALRKSRWFTRGWTLQELLASNRVEFYSREGEWLGDKSTLELAIHEITDVPISALRGTPLSDFDAKERIRWVSKRDTKRMEDKVYCLQGILNVSMSPAYGEGRKAFFRLKDEMIKSYGWQLEGIEQFFVASDSYSCDSRGPGPITNNAKTISPLDRRRTLLLSLGFDQMDSRRSTIKSAYSTTCQWILKHPAYMDWIDHKQLHQHRGFLWINGKPGAGKSTLVKFAQARADRERPEQEILLSYFFNARGDELERSTVGMYRSILFQLLNKAVDLQNLLDDFDHSSTDESGCPTWEIETLCRLFSEATARLGQRRLKCFVDALDECDEQQVQEMIFFFEGLGQVALENGTQLYVCFASRHYPTIDIRSGRQLTLEDENGHAEDLTKYVQSHLRAGKGKYIEEMRTQICEKANGVFMWVVLVVDILNNEFRQGRIFAVRKRLQEIPPKLGDLFKAILTRDGANMTDLWLCLQWILFAKRPLKREEFYFAMAAGLDPEPEHMTAWDSEYITTDDMNRFVLTSSKGLAELTKSKTTPTVQFIHESVRDYLIKDGGLYELWPELGEDLYSAGHDQLKRCCQNYLAVDISGHVPSDQTLPKASSGSAKDLRQALTVNFPFLEYASKYILHHADEAAMAVSQDEFLRSFALGTWIKNTNVFEIYEVRRYTLDASPLYILAERNYARLIRTTCKHGPLMGVRGERYHYPLFAALANGHQAAVQALLNQNRDSPIGDTAAQMKYGLAFSYRKDQTPLLWALENGYTAVAESLYTCADVDLEARDRKGRTALSWAAEKGFDTIVTWLLDGDADIEDRDTNARTALIYAAIGGGETIVRQLLAKNAFIEATDRFGNTALIMAATNGHEVVVQQLLANGANIEATDRVDNTALIRAARNGHEVVVQQLLAKGANIEATDRYGDTALIGAARNGYEVVVQQLLAKGANIEATDRYGDTALIGAARNGREVVVQQLLAKGANIEATDRVDNTALIRAARNGYEVVIQQLLAEGANIEATTDYGGTALILAAQFNRKTIVEQLLANSASIEARDKDGKSALDWALKEGHTDIVTRLRPSAQALEGGDFNHLTLLSSAVDNVD